MNFYIDIDNQESICGWLTPDNPSLRPRFILEIPNRQPLEFEANVLRPDILGLGWHSTGQVGFSIDSRLLPDIRDIEDIRVLDFHTGITIYRRAPAYGYIPGRLLFFDCSLMPQWRLFAKIGQQFSVHYSTIDRLPLETALAIFWNNMAQSSFICGAPNFLRYSHAFRAREFRTVALLRHPMEEFAERLLFMKALSRSSALSSIREQFAQQEQLISLAEKLDVEDKHSLVSFFRLLDESSKALLRSPMTRTFGTEITDSVDRKKVSTALENLATIDLVGTRSRFSEFAEIFDGLIERHLLEGEMLSTVPGVDSLAGKLAKIGPALDLVEDDLALYAFAEDAMKRSVEDRR